jgi:hypothetical protein
MTNNNILEGIDNERKEYMILSWLLGFIGVIYFIFLMNESINNLNEFKESQTIKNNYEIKITELKTQITELETKLKIIK